MASEFTIFQHHIVMGLLFRRRLAPIVIIVGFLHFELARTCDTKSYKRCHRKRIQNMIGVTHRQRSQKVPKWNQHRCQYLSQMHAKTIIQTNHENHQM